MADGLLSTQKGNGSFCGHCERHNHCKKEDCFGKKTPRNDNSKCAAAE